MAKTARFGLLFVCASQITACGGGGGGSSPPPAVAIPVAAAISSYSQTSHMYNLSGSVNGSTFAAAYTYTPGPSAMFEGQTTATETTTVTISQNGATISSGSSVNYFIASPFRQIGSVVTAGSGTGQYSVDANWQALPASAMVGQSGSIETETSYADSTKATTVATTTTSWSVTSASPMTAWFCANSMITPVSGSPGSESDCYQIDQSGNVLAYKVTVQVNGTSITFQ